jgi:predicted ATPase
MEGRAPAHSCPPPPRAVTSGDLPSWSAAPPWSTSRPSRDRLLASFDAPATEDAERSFRTAIDLARRRGEKSLELRAATSLARLWQQQGKRDVARRLLADIYGWFTKGFETADLKEAKALLGEL